MILCEVSAAMVAAWSDPRQQTTMTLDESTAFFHNLGPRARFLKTLPLGASLLDAGAGDGSLAIFAHWPPPARPDLELFAWAGDRGSMFDRYTAAEVGFWPQNGPDFGGRRFDAILCANFIEHIDDPSHFIREIGARLTERGRFYLEWPRPEAKGLPSTADLAAYGVRVMTGRYDDDATHRPRVPTVEAVTSALSDVGLVVTEQGINRVPMVDRELAIHARRSGDIVSMTLAYWSATGWCRYLVAERP